MKNMNETIDLKSIYIHKKITVDFIEKTHKYLQFDSTSEKWCFIFEYNIVPETFLHKYSSEFDSEVWSVVSAFQELSEDFMCEYKDKLDWEEISQNQRFSKEFATRFKDKIEWTHVITRQMFDFDFLINNIPITDSMTHILATYYTSKFTEMLMKYITR